MTSAWIGRTETAHDIVSAGAVRRLRATIGDEAPEVAQGEAAPLLSHWLHFLPSHPLRETGADGHPKTGGFLPPAPLPRRMWAGSRIEFGRPLRVGSAVSRRSTILDVKQKSGRTGELMFVTVQHEVGDKDGACVRERQEIVYRDFPPIGQEPPKAIAAPASPGWSRRIDPDPVLLFRYSALSFNGHRIHYDRPYATDVEGYPGLVVHGPLIATLLLHEFVQRHPQADVASYEFRAIRPICDTGPFFVCGAVDGETAALFAADAGGALCVEATASLRAPERRS